MDTIFVSSTFRDMNAERDVIRQRVVPAVNAAAAKYGESVWCTDLRWGVDTSGLGERESDEKVLRVCLDEIDRSSPPFVILLGDRYGWIPDPARIGAQADRRQLHLRSTEISVTALEIEYGAFLRRYTPIVYFREAVGAVPGEYRSEDAAHRAGLEALKARLRRLCGDSLRVYRVRFGPSGPDRDDLNAFAERLTGDICAVLRPRWQKNAALGPRERETMLQERFLAEAAGRYVPASRDEDRLFAALSASASQRRQTVLPFAGLFLYLCGEGMGKSMLFARIAERLRADPRSLVLACTAGLTPESGSASEILRTFVFALEKRAGWPHAEEEEDEAALRSRLEDLCAHLAGKGFKLFFMVDGFEALIAGPDRDRLVFLPSSGREGTAMLLTARDGGGIPFGTVIEPSPVTFREQRSVLDGMLAYYRRELSPDAGLLLLERSLGKGFLHPTVLLMRLLMMDAGDYAQIARLGGTIGAISAYQKGLIADSPEDTGEAAYRVLEAVGRAVGSGAVREVCALLSLSPFGLRESDLAAILGDRFSPLDLAILIHSWEECFLITSDGRITFRIGCAAAAYRRHIQDPASQYDRIFRHLCALDRGDSFRRRYLLFFARAATRLTAQDTVRYIGEVTEGEGMEEAVRQAAYALWRGRAFDGGVRVVEWIRYLRSLTETDLKYLSAFLDLWPILAEAEAYYRLDPEYGCILEAWRADALELKKGCAARFAGSLDMRLEDCSMILEGFGRGEARMRDPFAQPRPDRDDAAAYLSSLAVRLDRYTSSMTGLWGRKAVPEADRIRDRLLELCRTAWVGKELPGEALAALGAVTRYETAAAGPRMSAFSAAGEAEELMRRHPSLRESIASAAFYAAEAARLSHALREEKIPPDRRKRALALCAAARDGFVRAIREEPSREACLGLMGVKMTAARLLEEIGSPEASAAALNELLDACSLLSRAEGLPGDPAPDPFTSFILCHRTGVLARKNGKGNVMETAFENSLVYAARIPDARLDLPSAFVVLRDQAHLLEETGHPEAASRRLGACRALLERMADSVSGAPKSERSFLRDWEKEIGEAEKRIGKAGKE